MRVVEDIERGAVRIDVVDVVDGDKGDVVVRSGREHGELEGERVDVRVDVVRYGDSCSRLPVQFLVLFGRLWGDVCSAGAR